MDSGSPCLSSLQTEYLILCNLPIVMYWSQHDVYIVSGRSWRIQAEIITHFFCWPIQPYGHEFGKSFLASSLLTLSLTVMTFLVIRAETVWFKSLANLTSRLVRIPTNLFLWPSTTGMLNYYDTDNILDWITIMKDTFQMNYQKNRLRIDIENQW